ncbi:MAG: class I SAM-dependent methyltransferase [Acidobacteria bacterium]|nr:class I SAM-dependent methyltransferase [Acidobacteriota bacterium]
MVADTPSLSSPNEYDDFADIYQVWTDTAASAQANLEFYLDLYREAVGPVVELGVGDGRIAVPAACRGQDVIGVDLSPAMLERCRARAMAAGVLDRLAFVCEDFRRFQLDVPAGLIALPYHSLGHVLSLEDKRSALAHVFSQLEPGGRFVFDDFYVTPALVDQMRKVQLRATYRSSGDIDTLLWVTSLVDEASQAMTVVTWEDFLDTDGVLMRRRYRRLHLSWLDPSQARSLLTEAGFVIDACYGGFDRTPFSEATAREQIWIARRPGADVTAA